MIFEILTLFPEMFDSYLKASIMGRALSAGLVQVRCHNLRDFASGKHRVTDDTPYGGGSGMVMKPEPLVRGIQAIQKREPDAHVILLSPQGKPFNQKIAWEFSRRPRLALICGRYEGVDERVRLLGVDEEISIGDYILTGGEPAALVLMDAVSRLIPGVLGDQESPQDETFSSGLLEYPQYTRPREFMGKRVPEVLLSGDHRRVRAWRRQKALEKTFVKRPDLLEQADLTEEDLRVLMQLRKPEAADL